MLFTSFAYESKYNITKYLLKLGTEIGRYE